MRYFSVTLYCLFFGTEYSLKSCYNVTSLLELCACLRNLTEICLALRRLYFSIRTSSSASSLDYWTNIFLIHSGVIWLIFIVLITGNFLIILGGTLFFLSCSSKSNSWLSWKRSLSDSLIHLGSSLESFLVDESNNPICNNSIIFLES